MSRQATQTAPAAAPDAAVAGRSPHLDQSLERAHKLAVSQGHAGVTAEHLLFALSEDPEALGVLGASTISIDRLRADITTHLAQLPHEQPSGKPVLPSPDLLKVLKLAAMAAQQSSRRQIDGAIVLAAVIGDASTPSAGMLRAHGLTFSEVIRVLQRGAAAPAPVAPAMPQPPQIQQAASAKQPAAAPAPAPAPAPSGDSSTDEILASVRARLKEAAPPAVARRPDPAPPALAAKPVEPTPTSPPPAELPGVEAKLEPAAAAPGTAPVAKAPARPVDPPTQPVATQPPRPPSTSAVPRTPDDLAPPRLAVTAAAPPPLPTATAPLPSAAAPRLPSPPPLPSSVQAALAPASVQPPPLVAQRQHHPEPPSIPPVTVDMRALVNALPRALRCGQSAIIEINVPRRALEIPLAHGHRWPPLRITTFRLKTADDRAHVELVSPETLWIGPPRAHQGADDATWRWRVTPRTSGRLRLTLAGAARIVGSEGTSAEVPFGEETIEIDVRRRRSRRGVVGALLFGNLLFIGLLAMIMSGRAAEIGRGIWSGISSLWGG